MNQTSTFIKNAGPCHYNPVMKTHQRLRLIRLTIQKCPNYRKGTVIP